jgi:integrase
MTVQPIKDNNQIRVMLQYLERNGNMRDPLLLKFGLNTGLRIKDILGLKVKYLFNGGGELKEYLDLFESKTIKRRNRVLKKIRLNSKIRPVLTEYVEYYELKDDDYLFFSFNDPSRAIDRIRAYVILRKAAVYAGVENFGTHSMRKTLAYNVYTKTKDLALVMKMLNHKDPDHTLRYIGVDQHNIDSAYEEFAVDYE